MARPQPKRPRLAEFGPGLASRSGVPAVFAQLRSSSGSPVFLFPGPVAGNSSGTTGSPRPPMSQPSCCSVCSRKRAMARLPAWASCTLSGDQPIRRAGRALEDKSWTVRPMRAAAWRPPLELSSPLWRRSRARRMRNAAAPARLGARRSCACRAPLGPRLDRVAPSGALRPPASAVAPGPAKCPRARARRASISRTRGPRPARASAAGRTCSEARAHVRPQRRVSHGVRAGGSTLVGGGGPS